MQLFIGSEPIFSERTAKGKSLLDALENYVVLDLETTGLDPHWDSIIEIAAARVEGGVIVDSFQSLINPKFEIDEFITELTGITNDMLSTAPLLPDVLPRFVEFVGSAVIVGHNVNFDINFLYDKCTDLLQSAFVNNFIDTMRVSRRLFKEEAHHRLSDLIKRFGSGDDVEHRAWPDVLHTFHCYEYMKRHAADNQIDLPSLYPVKKSVSANDITPRGNDFDENSPIFGKLFVFTGVLEKMARKDAMQFVVDVGGFCGDNVTKNTNYLVLGNNDYCTTIKDGKSKKQKKAEQLKLSGLDIEIISESVFYEMASE